MIANHYGFEVPTLIITHGYLTQIFDNNPFKTHQNMDVKDTTFTFLKELPNADKVSKFREVSFPNETIIINERMIYFHSTLGYAKIKFTHTFIEKKLGVQATIRNYRTTAKLIEMSKP